MISSVKSIYNPTITLIGLLTVTLTLLLVQFTVVTYLSQKILNTTKEQYSISRGSYGLNKIFIGVLDMETAVRGYVLTNDRNYLEPYFGANAEINKSLINFSENLSNNVEWKRELQKFIPLIKSKMEYLDQVIKLQDVNDVSSLKVKFAGQPGNRAMDSIRLTYENLDFLLRTGRSNIATINLERRSFLLWVQYVINSIVIIFILIATYLGFKILKTYKNLNAMLHADSTTDTLTKLANRRQFLESAELALAKTTRGETGLAILFIDLNGFKKINDTFGHQVGDDLLKTFATRLTTSMRSSDLVARIGGDEFAILISGNFSTDGLEIFQKHIVEVISAPLPSGAMKGKCLTVGIGCAVYPENGVTVKNLLEAADANMYSNKRMHQNQGLAAADI